MLYTRARVVYACLFQVKSHTYNAADAGTEVPRSREAFSLGNALANSALDGCNQERDIRAWRACCRGVQGRYSALFLRSTS